MSLKFKIEAAPTILFYRSGNVIDRVDGADANQITVKLKKHCGITDDAQSKAQLEERLKKLINKHKIVIFMKGNKEGPRCGFSKQLIHIINETG